MHHDIQQTLNELAIYFEEYELNPECIEIDSPDFYTPEDLESLNAMKLSDSELNYNHTISLISDDMRLSLVNKEV